jgi:hypothetical protein
MLKKFGEVYGANNNFSSLNEAKEPDMVIPADDSSDIKEEVDIIGGILKKAGVDAKCKDGLDQVEIHLKDKKDAKKAQKAIEKAGYQVGWNESEVHEAKGMISKDLIKATEKMHAEQLKLQELQKKFAAEADAGKKEGMKKDLIAQHKKAKQTEADFQHVLGQEDVDLEDEMYEAQGVTDDIKDKLLQTLIDISAELGDSDVDDYMAEIEAATDEMGAEHAKLKQIVVNLIDKYAHFGTELVKAISAIKKL